MSLSTSALDDSNNSTSIAGSPFIFTCIFIPVQILCVGLRYLSRWLVKSAWGIDDVLVFISLILQIGLAALVLDQIKHGGIDQHEQYVENLAPETLIVYLKDLFALTIVYTYAVVIPKLAVLVLYHRIFPTKIARLCVFILSGALAIYFITMTILILAACRPISLNWNFPESTKCINKVPLYIWGSAPNIVTDAFMLALPLPIIWKLQIQTRAKVGLTLTFLVGSAGLITSILRVNVFRTIDSVHVQQESTHLVGVLDIWIQLEPGCYLASACMLTWRPLIDHLNNSRWMRSLKSLISRRPAEIEREHIKGTSKCDSSLKPRPLHTNGTYRSSIQNQGFVRLNNSNTASENIMVTRNLVRDEDQEVGKQEEIFGFHA